MSSKRKLKSVFVSVCLLLACAQVSLAADGPVVTVGSATLNEKEMLELLSSNTGGNAMMIGLMLGQSSLKERRELAEQMADALVFAEAARGTGLALRDDVAFKIKWQTMQILTQAYFEENAAKWEMNDKALKNYYETHKEEFYQQPAAHVRHILCEKESEALDAVMEIYRSKDFAKAAAEFSRDPNNAKNGGDLGWVEKGMLDPEVEKAIDGARIGSLVGPVKSGYGWHILEVTERRPGRQLGFDEAVQEVAQRLQRFYLDKELTELKAKYKVTIDEEALENLGGVKAPAEEAK